MKKGSTILCALSFSLVLWASARTQPGQIDQHPPGNIPDGMYSIMGESSHRCLEVPNSSCRDEIGLQTLDCDPTEKSNNQKFNVVADGTGYYTITAVHSDLCLEIYDDKALERIGVRQNVCSPGIASQKWAMSQYGDNLEIRAAQNNQCMDVVSRNKRNYAPISTHPCVNGTNQRWRLSKKTLNTETGVICRASPSHPERNCSGLNAKQEQINLGKTLTKTRCEDACRASNVSGCKWESSQ
jgi:hypothetical protein